MTLTTPERLTVDGVDMKTLAKNVETLAATLRTPGRRGANAVTAGRSGVVRTPNKLHEAPVYTWPMWVVGCDDDGSIPTDSTERQQFYENVDELTALFGKDGVLDVRHTQPGSIAADVTNLVPNPSARNASGLVATRKNVAAPTQPAPTNSGATLTNEVEYGGKTWTRVTSNVPGTPVRKTVSLANLVNGLTYTASWEVANDSATPTIVSIDWCDQAVSTYTINPGEMKRISASGSKVTYDNVYRFTDLAIGGVAGATILFREIQVEPGSVATPYFDGYTPASGDFTYDWDGDSGLSASREWAPKPFPQVTRYYGTNAYDVGGLPTYQTHDTDDGDTAYRFMSHVSGLSGMALAKIPVKAETLYTVGFRARAVALGAATVNLQLRVNFWGDAGYIGPVTLPLILTMSLSEEWSEYRITITTAPGTALLEVIPFLNSGTPSDIMDYIDFTVVEGDYTGELFDGSSGPGFTWNGDPDASTSTWHADVRQADCECTSGIDFTTVGVNPIGKFAVELQNLNAYWADTFDTTERLLIGEQVLDQFSGSTAPLDDATYEIVGPITNPQIRDLSKPNSFVQYNDVIPAGQSLILDAAAWTLTGTGGLVADLTKLVVSGMAGRMLRLVPNGSRTYAAELVGSATTADTMLIVTGRRKYLVG